jgi:hypothetical protein
VPVLATDATDLEELDDCEVRLPALGVGEVDMTVIVLVVEAVVVVAIVPVVAGDRPGERYVRALAPAEPYDVSDAAATMATPSTRPANIATANRARMFIRVYPPCR